MQEKNKFKAFTLIEILVVVFIIGIASASIVYRSGSHNQGRQIQSFAEQFKSKLQVVREQSLLQMKIYGLMIKDKSYQFCQYQQKPSKAWTAVADKDPLWRNFKFPPDVNVTFAVEKSKTNLEGTGASCHPQIVFFPSGDITGFMITVSSKKFSRIFKIVGVSDGSISLEEPK